MVPCLVVAYTDIRSGKVYDRITLPMILVGAAYSLHTGCWSSALAGALFAAAAVGACVFAGGMGGGDLKLGIGLGTWFGFPGAAWVLLVGSLLAFAFGALRKAARGELKPWLLYLARGLALRAVGVRGALILESLGSPRADVLPFGAFLCAGAFVVFFAGLSGVVVVR
ncbi:MAG: prepilin peptidase [Desulfotomaculales bacterium]